MDVVSAGMDNPTWVELVHECKVQGMDLTARQTSFPPTDATEDYQIYAAAVTEVEVDVLTGERNIK